MALVAGPGVGGSHSATGPGPAELTLVVDKHVKYIQELDSVREFVSASSSDVNAAPAKR